MAYPTMEVSGRTIIVLQDIDDVLAATEPSNAALRAIKEAARRHPDAVAFGYLDGVWLPAA